MPVGYAWVLTIERVQRYVGNGEAGCLGAYVGLVLGGAGGRVRVDLVQLLHDAETAAAPHLDTARLGHVLDVVLLHGPGSVRGGSGARRGQTRHTCVHHGCSTRVHAVHALLDPRARKHARPRELNPRTARAQAGRSRARPRRPSRRTHPRELRAEALVRRDSEARAVAAAARLEDARRKPVCADVLRGATGVHAETAIN